MTENVTEFQFEQFFEHFMTLFFKNTVLSVFLSKHLNNYSFY